MPKRAREEPVRSIEDLTEEELENLDDDEIQALLDQAENESALDNAEVKRLLMQFEKKNSTNQQKRMKYSEDPEKFMSSEMELHEAIRELHKLASAPETYVDIVSNGSVPSLLGLVSHENTDITVEGIHLLSELVDPGTIHDTEGADGATQLVDVLLENGLGLGIENGLAELLVQNLARLDEAHEEDQQGVYHTFSVFENLLELQPELAEVFVEKTELLQWLVKRLKEKFALPNRVYCSEIISILLQGSSVNQAKFGQIEGAIDTLLIVAARYKKREPSSAEEQELVENVFDAICSVLMVEANQELFVKAEGLELMKIMVKEKGFAKRRALKVLNFALKSSQMACEQFVEILGNKTLFPAFMKPASKSSAQELLQDEENIVCCLSHLLQNSSSEPLARIVCKFSKEDLGKLDRLLELWLQYNNRVKDVHPEETLERLGELGEANPEEIHYLARLDAGLYTLQLVSLIWGLVLYHGPKDTREHTAKLLHQYQLHPEMFTSILKEYQSNQEETDTMRQNATWAITGFERLMANPGSQPDLKEADEDGDATPDTYGEAEEDGDATP